MENFDLNKECSISVEQIGEEQHPILIIDDFLEKPSRLVDVAAFGSDFTPVSAAGNFYPGIRAPAPREYAACVYRNVHPFFKEVFGVPSGRRAKVSLCAFSLTTMRPHELNSMQSLPHFDTSNPNQFAALHYLFEKDLGGTSFYRHRKTGFEAITRARTGEYLRILKSSLADRPNNPGGYVNGDTNLFERISTIRARFNRLIIYQSFLLHSGSISANQEFSPNPHKGRLTANTFFVLE